MRLYSPETVDFLWRLRLNNSREWFHEHKEDFERLMNGPTKDLANALFEHFREAYPKHDWNLHISRIYRDARRLYGRGPMNDHLWFTIWADREEMTAPSFYFSFTPEYYEYGMGCWSYGHVVMDRFRADIRRDPEKAEKLVRKFRRQKEFTLGGQKYKKHKVETTHLLQDWTDRKYLSFDVQKEQDEVCYSDRLFDTIRDGFDRLMPYYMYFLTLPELEEYMPALNEAPQETN